MRRQPTQRALIRARNAPVRLCSQITRSGGSAQTRWVDRVVPAPSSGYASRLQGGSLISRTMSFSGPHVGRLDLHIRGHEPASVGRPHDAAGSEARGCAGTRLSRFSGARRSMPRRCGLRRVLRLPLFRAPARPDRDRHLAVGRRVSHTSRSASPRSPQPAASRASMVPVPPRPAVRMLGPNLGIPHAGPCMSRCSRVRRCGDLAHLPASVSVPGRGRTRQAGEDRA